MTELNENEAAQRGKPNTLDGRVNDSLAELTRRLSDQLGALEKRMDQQLEALKDRLGDFRAYVAGGGVLVLVVLSLFGLWSKSTLAEDKADLREFKTDLRAEVRRDGQQATLEILTVDGQILMNRDLPVTIATKGEEIHINIEFVLRNVGKGWSGPFYTKIYSRDPVQLGRGSTDDRGFQYEGYMPPRASGWESLPGGSFSASVLFVWSIPRKPPPGRYPMRIKVYYGNGQVVVSDFTAIVQ